MALEMFGTALNSVLTLTSPVAGIFAVLVFISLFKKEAGKFKRPLLITFGSIALGFFLYGIAQIIYTVLDSYGLDVNASLADVVWIAGYFLVLFGFVFFSNYIYKEKKNLLRGLSVTAIIAAAVIGILYYLISSFIIGAQMGETEIQIFLDYLYPILSGLIFVSSLSVYFFFRGIKPFGNVIFLLAINTFISFVGDSLWTYYTWNSIYGISGVISDTSYLIADVIAIIAFHKLLKITSKKVSSGGGGAR